MMQPDSFDLDCLINCREHEIDPHSLSPLRLARSKPNDFPWSDSPARLFFVECTGHER